MNYSVIRKYDTSNWSGINTTIFFSGCHFNCDGCFNKVAQDFNYGQEFNDDTVALLSSYLDDPHVSGLCILGGEPFDQELGYLTDVIRELKSIHKKPIHIWSGYTYEEIVSDKYKRYLLAYCDTLVDGRFVLSKKDLNLKYRGSSNQRVIDVKKSLNTGEVCLIRD